MKKISNEEMNEIIDEYTNLDMKVSDIISKHQLNISIRQLRNILPLLKSEVNCEYCNTQMYAMYPTRQNIKNWKLSDFICKICGHEIHNSRYSFFCECSNCNEEQKKIKLEQIETLKSSTPKPVLENTNKKFYYNELNLKEQITLFFLILLNGNENWSHIIADQNHSFYWLSQLLTMIIKGYIIPNNNSDYNINDYLSINDLNHGLHTINVDFTEEERKELKAGIFFLNNYTPDELIELYHEYLYNDIMIQFEQMMINRGLEQPYENRTKKEQFIELLQKISYKQLFHLCTKCANFYLEKVTLGQFTKPIASRKAMDTVINLYNFSVAKNWTIFSAEFDDIDIELIFFLHFVLNKDKDILNEVATTENLFFDI